MNPSTSGTISPELLDRFESIADIADISLTRPAGPEWEVTVIHRTSRESFAERDLSMPDILARVVAGAQRRGWLLSPAGA
ncbi:MAG: hypothetical protein WD749_09075 [Phycisphaerales bacterium]